MNTVQRKWIQDMRKPILEITAHATALVTSSPPRSQLQTLLPCLVCLRLLLVAAIQSRDQNLQVAASNKKDVRLFFADFSRLVEVTVQQLDSLGCAAATSLGGIEAQLFYELWTFLALSCESFSTVVDMWPAFFYYSGDETPLLHSLFAAFHKLLAWLLCFTRTPAWRLVKTKLGRKRRNNTLVAMLAQPTHCMFKMSQAPPANVIRMFSGIPPRCVPMLCCIVSEQFGPLPQIVPPVQGTASASEASYTHGPSSDRFTNVCIPTVLSLIPMTIKNLKRVDQQIPTSGFLRIIESPAVLHCLKVLLVTPQEALGSSHKTHQLLLLETAEILSHLLEECLKEECVLLGGSLSVHDRGQNRDVHGLPLHLNPAFSQAALVSDAHLLHVLSSLLLSKDVALRKACWDIQLRTLEMWLNAARRSHGNDDALSDMAASVVGLAKQCCSHGMRVMELKQREEMSDVQPGSISGGPGQQSQHQSSDDNQASLSCDALSVTTLLMGVYNYMAGLQMQERDKEAPLIACHRLQTLSSWCVMPGRVVAIEALHRSISLHLHPKPFLGLRGLALLVGLSVIDRPQNALMCSTFNQHVSLAATVRKLLWTYAQGVERGHMNGRPVPPSEGRWEQNRDYECVSTILRVCIKAALKLDAFIDACSGGGNRKSCSSSCGGSSSNVTTSRSAADMGKGCFICAASIAASQPLHSGNKEQADNIKELAHAQFTCHQLQTIFLCIAVQVGLWARRCDHIRDTFSFQVLFYQLMQQLDDFDNSQLRGMVKSLLTGSSKPAATSHLEVSVAWERYAVSNFKGRLLPGCCNHACTNLSGVSEACVKTLLCSGCRRARYCSVECQKSAWLHGGHRHVCAT